MWGLRSARRNGNTDRWGRATRVRQARIHGVELGVDGVGESSFTRVNCKAERAAYVLWAGLSRNEPRGSTCGQGGR